MTLLVVKQPDSKATVTGKNESQFCQKIWQISTIYAVTGNISGHNWMYDCHAFISTSHKQYIPLLHTLQYQIFPILLFAVSRPTCTYVQDLRFSRWCRSAFRSSATSCRMAGPVAPDALAELSNCGTHTAGGMRTVTCWHSKIFRYFFL